MGKDLEPHLAVLERHEISSTSGLNPYFQPEDLAAAILALSLRTHGAVCHRHDVLAGQPPGVDVALAAAYVRTGRADTMAARIDFWLASELSENLCRSLANERAGSERHAVLVFDPHTEPEFVAAGEQGTAFCPTAELTMPDKVDVLWFILGPVACRYSPEGGWRSVAMPDMPYGN